MPSTPTHSLIRKLTSKDIPAALVLSAFAGWNQTAEDWKLLLQPDVGEGLGIECDGKIVATASLACYGDTLAWLGMVLTHPDYRRRGLARCLVEHALHLAQLRKIRCVKLDATDMGRSLYESLGFREEQIIERWSGSGLPVRDDRAFPAAALPFELDREAFGADRAQVLTHLACMNPPLATKDGFAFVRSGATANYLGPCMARTPEAARSLIRASLAQADGDWNWDLLASNSAAVSLARECNFQPRRRLLRMAKGFTGQGNDSMIFAGGGFELG